MTTGPGNRNHRPSAATLAAVLGGSGVLTAATLVGSWSDRPAGPLFALDITAGVLSWLLTPLMLWRPVAVTAVTTVLAAVSPAATPVATIGALQVAWRRPPRVAIAVSVAGIAAHAVQGLWRTNGSMSYGWWLILVTVAYSALLGWGAWAQARAALIRSLHDRARRAEAEQGRRVAEARMLERRKIAHEMHDVLAHRLSLLATFAGALEYRPDAAPEQLSRAAGIVRDGVHQALEELREVITLLRDDDQPAGGEPLGVSALGGSALGGVPLGGSALGGSALGGVPLGGSALGSGGRRPQPVLADVPRLVEESRSAGTEVLLSEAVHEPAEAPPVIARTAYRVIQEGLTNARKHAAGRPVRVTLSGGPGKTLEIDVRNDLVPPGASPPGWSGGAGLVGLTERVHLAGGILDHETRDGEFQLHASLPWPA